MLQAGVPDILKQRFCTVRNERLQADRVFNGRCEGSYSSKFLYTSSGELTPYVAMINGNMMVIHAISSNHDEAIVCRHSFKRDVVIVDVDYLPSTDGSFGIVAAVNSVDDAGENVIVLLTKDSSRPMSMSIIRKMAIPYKITAIKTIICDKEMPLKSAGLNARFSCWPHIIAVGTKPAHAYVAYFHSVHPSRTRLRDWDTTVSTKYTDALKSFHNDGGYFIYQAGESSRRVASDVSEVTAFGYVERHRTLLIGFNFGGIQTVALTDSPTIRGLEFCCNNPVRHFAYMEPDDDPRFHVWFWAAHGGPSPERAESKSSITMVLYEGRCTTEEDLPFEQRKFNDADYGIVLRHLIPNSGRDSSWVSLRTLVKEREFNGSTTLSEESQLNLSQSRPGSDRDRSMVFFSYKDKDGRLMGGLFDMNAYYFKRLIPSVFPDKTVARQNAFISVVWPNLSVPDGTKFCDLAVDSKAIHRFASNNSDADQLFYASSLDISLIHVATDSECFDMCLPSIQAQFLSKMRKDVSKYVSRSDSSGIAEQIRSLGLVKPDQTAAVDSNDNMVTLLTVMLFYGPPNVLTSAVKKCSSMDVIEQIRNVIWMRVSTMKDKVNDTENLMFFRFAKPLTPEGRRALSLAHCVFDTATQTMKVLISAAEDAGATKEQRATISLETSACSNLFEYVKCISNLLSEKLLPINEDVKSIRQEMCQAVTIRRRQAESRGRRLYVDELVSKMQQLVPNEPFWLQQTPEQWYPPSLFCVLNPIQLTTIPAKRVRDLLIYYMIDLVTCGSRFKYEIRERGADGVIGAVERILHQVLSVDSMNGMVQMAYANWQTDCEDEVENEAPTTKKTDQAHGQQLAAAIPEDPAVKDKKSRLRAEEMERLFVLETLTSDEQRSMQELAAQVEYGMFAWACYLIKAKRYAEVPELVIPENTTNYYVSLYVRKYPYVRELAAAEEATKKADPAADLWPGTVIGTFNTQRIGEADERKSATPVRSSLFVPKTPVATKIENGNNRKRLAMRDEHIVTANETQETPPPAKRHVITLDFETTPDDRNLVPEDAMNRLNELVRTPKHRAEAAAQAEAMLDMTTPPENKQLPQPTSILRKSGVQSPNRASRIRFDLPDLSMCSAASIESPAFERSVNTKLNFDVDDDDEDDELEAGKEPTSSDFLRKEEEKVSDDTLETLDATMDMTGDRAAPNVDDDEEGVEEKEEVLDEQDDVTPTGESEANGTAAIVEAIDESESMISAMGDVAPTDSSSSYESAATDITEVIEHQEDNENEAQQSTFVVETTHIEQATFVVEEGAAAAPPSVKLVDYSFADSTMMETTTQDTPMNLPSVSGPVLNLDLDTTQDVDVAVKTTTEQDLEEEDNTSTASLNSSGVRGADGIMRTFEVQPEDDDETPPEMEDTEQKDEEEDDLTTAVNETGDSAAVEDVADNATHSKEEEDANKMDETADIDEELPLATVEKLSQAVKAVPTVGTPEKEPVAAVQSPQKSPLATPTRRSGRKKDRSQSPARETAPPRQTRSTPMRSAKKKAQEEETEVVKPAKATTARRSLSRAASSQPSASTDLPPSRAPSSRRRSVSRTFVETVDSIAPPPSPSRKGARAVKPAPAANDTTASSSSSSEELPLDANGKPLRGAAKFRWLLEQRNAQPKKATTTRKRTVSDSDSAPSARKSAKPTVEDISEETQEATEPNRRRSRSVTRRLEAPSEETGPALEIVPTTPSRASRSASRSKKTEKSATATPTRAARSVSRSKKEDTTTPAVVRRTPSRGAKKDVVDAPAPVSVTRSASRSKRAASDAPVVEAPPTPKRGRTASQSSSTKATPKKDSKPSKIPVTAAARKRATSESKTVVAPAPMRSRNRANPVVVSHPSVEAPPTSTRSRKSSERSSSVSSVPIPGSATRSSSRRKATIQQIDEEE